MPCVSHWPDSSRHLGLLPFSEEGMGDSWASPLMPPSPRLVYQTTSDTGSRRPEKLFSLSSGFSKSCLETISSETVKIYMDERSACDNAEKIP